MTVRRPCNQPGCPALVERGRCPAHQRSTAAPRPAGYYRAYPRAWRRLSAALLAERPTCERCGAPASCVDHVRPLAQGGDHDPGNLMALCSRCHASKTGRERRQRQIGS